MRTLGQMVLERIAESGSSPALRINDHNEWRNVSWAELGERMERIAAGLLTIEGGVPDRAAVTILGNTTFDWVTCDFALLSVGIRTVPVYATLLPPETGYLHQDTEAVVAIVEDAEQLDKVREFRDGFTYFETRYGPETVKVRHVVVMDPTGIEPADDWESLAELERRGAENLQATAQERKRRGDAVGRDATATYTYTSGTTGPPKAVIQTNDNHLSMLEIAGATGLLNERMREGGLFLFLPLAHSFGRLIEFAGPFFDVPIVISSIPTLVDDLKETRPSFFPAAPRVYEKMKAKIDSRVAGAPPTRRRLFHWALGVGRKTIPYRSRGEAMGLGLSLRYRLADRLVLSKLRVALGLDRAQLLLTGSAPIGFEVHEFFLAVGLNLIEAYGLTETCPGISANLPGAMRLGTVGRPLTGIDVEIASDGEILAKGPNVTPGYHNREDATAEAFDSEGWFHTGDLGSIDEDGFLKITGRKKELMKTSAGKFIAPAKLEARLKNLPMVQEAVVIADLRNYATALIAIDPEELEDWAGQTGNPADPQSDAVHQAVQDHIDAVNETLASFETVKYFRIVPPITIEDGLMTASLKVKRDAVFSRYADIIDGMYRPRTS